MCVRRKRVYRCLAATSRQDFGEAMLCRPVTRRIHETLHLQKHYPGRSGARSKASPSTCAALEFAVFSPSLANALRRIWRKASRRLAQAVRADPLSTSSRFFSETLPLRESRSRAACRSVATCSDSATRFFAAIRSPGPRIDANSGGRKDDNLPSRRAQLAVPTSRPSARFIIFDRRTCAPEALVRASLPASERRRRECAASAHCHHPPRSRQLLLAVAETSGRSASIAQLVQLQHHILRRRLLGSCAHCRSQSAAARRCRFVLAAPSSSCSGTAAFCSFAETERNASSALAAFRRLKNAHDCAAGSDRLQDVRVPLLIEG